MNNKLMIVATVTALAGLFAPALVFTSYAQDTVVVQSAAIDYSPTELFHSKFSVVEKGRPRIAFDAVRKNAGPFLNGYVEHLSAQNVDNLPKDDQLAYWLNVQNTLAIQALSFDTKKSNLKKLRGTGDEPGSLWTAPRFTYNGQSLSLADIETRLVTTSDDPNVLYGIYQGVRGGPRLSTKAYQGSTVHDVLDKAGKTYVNATGIVKTENQTAKVTPIYTWHKDSLFAGDDAKLIAHIRGHAYPRLANKLHRATIVEPVKLSYRTDKYEIKRARNASSYGSVSSGRSTRSGSSGGGFGS